MSPSGRLELHFGVGERWAWIAALSYGLTNVLLRVAAAHIDPWLGSLLRLLPTAALAWLILARAGFAELRPGSPRYLGARLIVYLVLGGTISYVIGNVLFFRAMADGGLAISTNALQGGTVWAGVILGPILLRERTQREQLAGAVVIAAGLTIIALSQLSNPGQLWFQGLLMALGAGFCYSMTNVLTRFVQRQRPALFAVLACSAAGGFFPLALIAAGRAIVDPAGMLTGLRAYDVGVILVLGVVNILALAAATQAVRYASVATTNSIGSAAVAFSFVASIVIFAEPVPPLMILGVAAVIGGILVGQTGRRATPAPTQTAAPQPSGPPADPSPEG